LLVSGRIVRATSAGRFVRFVDTENVVHLIATVTLTMVLAGVKEDIKYYTLRSIVTYNSLLHLGGHSILCPSHSNLNS